MSSAEQARWFSEHVHPHEPALRAYLSKRFPLLPDHDDLVQETYARLLRVNDPDRLDHPKAFLFATARNAAIDLFRRRKRRPQEAMRRYWDNPNVDAILPQDDAMNKYRWVMSGDQHTINQLRSVQASTVGSYFHDSRSVIAGIRHDQFHGATRDVQRRDPVTAESAADGGIWGDARSTPRRSPRRISRSSTPGSSLQERRLPPEHDQHAQARRHSRL